MAVRHVWTSKTLDAEELADLYEWLDRVPLSKPRSNVEKDFSDGSLAAEIVRFYYPDLVDFRMIRSCENNKEKTEQWRNLNNEVFDRVLLNVPSHVLTQLSIAKSGIAQSFLYNLRMSLALTGAQTQLFPQPQFMYDPRLGGQPYPIHSSAQSMLYNPAWAAAAAQQGTNNKNKDNKLPFIHPQFGMIPPEVYEANYLMNKNDDKRNNSNKSPTNKNTGKQSKNGKQSPSQRSQNGSVNGSGNSSISDNKNKKAKSVNSLYNVPPFGMPPHGLPPHGFPPGFPPNGFPPNGFPPNGFPQNGFPPNGFPPQNGFPPYGLPPPYSPNYPADAIKQTKTELHEKNKKLQDKDDEVADLKAQLKRMEQMVSTKNSKIQELNLQVEKLNTARGSGADSKPTGRSPLNKK